MSDLLHYYHAQAKTLAAKNAYNHTAVALNIAHIKERLAEIKSQHEPLHSLTQGSLSERERLYAVAFYVVVGQMPNQVTANAIHEESK